MASGGRGPCQAGGVPNVARRPVFSGSRLGGSLDLPATVTRSKFMAHSVDWLYHRKA